MSFIEKAKLFFQLKTTWILLAHLFIIFPIFAKILYDVSVSSQEEDASSKKERSAWVDLGIWMLILGAVYHVYLGFDMVKMI
jgi:succinate dehydrogenase/fumarate reductase cytochrome b subunit